MWLVIAYLALTICPTYCVEVSKNDECANDAVIDEGEVPSDIDVYLEWARKNGAKFPKLFINQSLDDPIRGIFFQALEKIKKGEVVLYIPEHLLISDGSVMRNKIGWLASKEWIKTSEVLTKQIFAIATFLLRESKNPDSYWKPYIDTLPKVDHLPLNFIELARAELRNTAAI